MNTIFNKAFKDYIIMFHQHRDYFECHEIMEDAWKTKSRYTKQDPEVALIMLATAMYHLRRNNTRGAKTLLNKTIGLLTFNQKCLNDYFDVDALIRCIQTIQLNNTYESITIPLKDHHSLQRTQHQQTKVDIPDDIIHKHYMRDRTDVIRLRLQALNDKYPIQNAPNQTHNTDETE